MTQADMSDFLEVAGLDNDRIFSVEEGKAGRSPRAMELEIAAAAEL